MKGYAFDFDGTLIDSMKMWRNLSKTYLNSKGIEMTEEIAQKMTAMSIEMSAKFFRDELGIKESKNEIIDEIGSLVLHQYLNVLELKPYAYEILDFYREKDVPLCLATATNEEYVLPALERFGLRQYFEFIQTCDNSGYAKSDTRFYDTVASNFRLKHQKITLIDDAVYALNAARKAGLQTWAIYDVNSDILWKEDAFLNHRKADTLREIVQWDRRNTI